MKPFMEIRKCLIVVIVVAVVVCYLLYGWKLKSNSNTNAQSLNESKSKTQSKSTEIELYAKHSKDTWYTHDFVEIPKSMLEIAKKMKVKEGLKTYSINNKVWTVHTVCVSHTHAMAMPRPRPRPRPRHAHCHNHKHRDVNVSVTVPWAIPMSIGIALVIGIAIVKDVDVLYGVARYLQSRCDTYRLSRHVSRYLSHDTIRITILRWCSDYEAKIK